MTSSTSPLISNWSASSSPFQRQDQRPSGGRSGRKESHGFLAPTWTSCRHESWSTRTYSDHHWKKISHFPVKTFLPTKMLGQTQSKSLKTFSNFQQSVIHGQGQFHFISEMKPSRWEKKWHLIISAKNISLRVTRAGTRHCTKTRSTGCSMKTEERHGLHL